MSEITNHPGLSERRSFSDRRLDDPAWAWSAYRPDEERPWGLRWAGHLYRRAAFGADWEQLQLALEAGPQATIDRLLVSGGPIQEFNRTHDEYEGSAGQSAGTDSLRAWWLRRMCQTPFPLLEKMTLFWHGHFAISGERVRNAHQMCRYAGCLRRNALGKFGSLLEELLNEPAVFAGLDARASRKNRSSDNLPRVLLEAFTLGPGQFTEADVSAVAAALSGWYISQNELRYSEREHLSSPATLLGETGGFRKEDLIRILLCQRATARWVVGKLYRWLISETNEPSDALLAPLVDSFVRDWDIAALVGTMLRSNLFFSPVAYRRKIKSPVEFALGLIRSLQGVVGTAPLGAEIAGLGQDLYNPPTVKGWAGHTCWINQYTLVGRARLAQALLAASGPYGGKLDVRGAVGAGKQDAEAAARRLVDLWLQGDLPEQAREVIVRRGGEPASSQDDRLRQAAIRIACLPEFQLA